MLPARSHPRLALVPLALAALGLAAGAAGAQSARAVREAAIATALDTLPPRPSLNAASDTNEAAVYYRLGRRLLLVRPDSASQALFWATRIDPEWADALHARAMAILVASGRSVKRDGFRRWEPDRQPTPRQVAVADALERLAFARSPFLNRTGDFLVFVGRKPRGDAEAGLWALVNEEHDTAAVRLGRALARRPGATDLRLARVTALVRLARYDSAATELARVVRDVDSLQATHITAGGASLAMLHYALGSLHVQTGDTLRAREAFEATLAADLSFPMARVRRAGLTLAAGDTAAALADLRAEAELRGDDPVVRLLYARVLSAAGRHQQAAGQLFAAIGLAPEYAAPYLEMGRMYDAAGDAAAALEWYEQFLGRAARADPLVPTVAARVGRLKAARPER